MHISDNERRLIRALRHSQKYKTVWLAWLIIGGGLIALLIWDVLDFGNRSSDSAEDRLAFIGLLMGLVALVVLVPVYLIVTWKGDKKTRLLLKLADEIEKHDASYEGSDAKR